MRNRRNFPKATVALIFLNMLGFIDQDFAICSAFKHHNLSHLSSNMTCLLFFGGFLEYKIGWRRFVLFYFICLAGAKILWDIMDGRPGIGASGAIYGIIGIDVCYFLRFHRSKIKIILYNLLLKTDLKLRIMIIILYLSGFICILIPREGAAGWSHAGGFMTGLLIGRMNKFKRDTANEKSLSRQHMMSFNRCHRC